MAKGGVDNTQVYGTIRVSEESDTGHRLVRELHEGSWFADNKKKHAERSMLQPWAGYLHSLEISSSNIGNNAFLHMRRFHPVARSERETPLVRRIQFYIILICFS